MASYFSKEAVAKLYDHVLEQCIVEFRQALGMLDRNTGAGCNPYAEEMRRGLRTMEAELARREGQRHHPRAEAHAPAPTSPPMARHVSHS